MPRMAETCTSVSKSMDIKTLCVILFFLTIIQCSALTYENDRSYKYSYETTVAFNDFYSSKSTSPQKDVGFQLTMVLTLTPVYQADKTQLIRLQITSAAMRGLSETGLEKKLENLLKHPLYFQLTEGMVGSLYIPEDEPVFCSNIKKGIASLFQVMEEQGERQELDVSGECSAVYSVGGTTITKTKKTCSNLEIAGQFTDSKGLFGVTVANEASLVYEIKEHVIQSVIGDNSHVAILNLRTDINTFVSASQLLNLLEVTAASETLSAMTMEEVLHHLDNTAGTSHTASLLPTGSEILYCTENCEKPADVLKKYKDLLVSEKMAKVESTKAFLQMLRTFRNAGKETIAEVLTGPESYNIIPQLIDAVTATQTSGAQKALMELLDFSDPSSIAYPERFLLGAAFSTHPGDYLLQDLLEIMKKDLPNSQLQESVALGMGALVHTYCKAKDKCKDQVISDYKKTVRENLLACENDHCRMCYLRSVGNAGLPDFLPTILQFAEGTDSSMVAVTAIKSLRRIPRSFISDKIQKALLRIFHQNFKKFDVSVRAAALEVILQSTPSQQVVRNILMASLYDDKNIELAAYIPKKMLDVAKSDIILSGTLKEILKDPRLNNYLLFGQKGKSSAFSSLLAATQDTSAFYGLYQLNANSGVMKTSSMVVDLSGKLGKQQFMSFDLYAEGLESLIGNSEDEADADLEPTAGMSLTLLDVMLRPVEFFRGSGGLMSAVWNAPSELVSALQVNLLLHDHSQKFHLSNGLIVDLQILGATSIDLSGLVSISLWNQNSHSLIKNSGALVIEGSMKLESEELQAGVSFSTEGEAFIDFVTDVEFYESPFKMCSQMKHPSIDFNYNINKFEKARGLKKTYSSTIHKSSTASPASFFLNQKNSEMCKILIPDA